MGRLRESLNLLLVLAVWIGIVVLAVTVVLMSSISGWRSGSEWLSALGGAAQTIQAIVTVVGILIAGVWAFYVFVLGRSFAGAVGIQIEHVRSVDREGKVGAVVSVRVQNVGRTLIQRERAQIIAVPVSEDRLARRLPVMDVMVASLDPKASKMPHPEDSAPLLHDLFDDDREGEEPGEEAASEPEGFEPGQELAEEVLLTFGEYRMVKVKVVFVGKVFAVLGGSPKSRRWSARIIVDGQGEANAKPERP